MDRTSLEKANIDSAKEVVIATSDDNTNIFLACMICELYPVPYLIVRIRDENKAGLLDDDRIKVISTSMLSVQAYKTMRAQEED